MDFYTLNYIQMFLRSVWAMFVESLQPLILGFVGFALIIIIIACMDGVFDIEKKKGM